MVDGVVEGLGLGLGIYAQHACKGNVHALSSSNPLITATQSSLLKRLLGCPDAHQIVPEFLMYVESAPSLNVQQHDLLVVAS